MQVATGVKKNLINGEWMPSASGEYLETYNPSTGEVLGRIARSGEEDVSRAVTAARERFESAEWQDMALADRGRILLKIAAGIRERQEELARIESSDTGKPLSQGRTDVQVAARYFEYYAGLADKITGTTIPIGKGVIDFTIREPWGISAQIVPWNYPIQIGCRGIAPALAAGNCVVVKPATEAPLTLLQVGAIATECGLPPGALNIVTGRGPEAGTALASHPDINHLTFTGSLEVGVMVMEAAAKNIVPVTLELGGKNPNIVFADADLDGALPVVTRAIIQNAGQTCSAGSRLLVEEKIYGQFVDRVKDRFQSIKIGPSLEDPEMGPLISEAQRKTVLGYMDVCRKEGVKVAVGGEAPRDPSLPANGYYFLPTVLDDVPIEATVFTEEIFGPVLTVTPFKEVDEALKLANASPYGLVGAVWTGDISKAHYLAAKIRAGQIFINTYGAGGGVEMPFGGYKKSGFGREKSIEAINAYTQVKNVAIRYG